MPDSSGLPRQSISPRRVLLHAWWLESRNRVRRYGSSWRVAASALVVLSLGAWLVAFWGPAILGLAARHLMSVAVVVAMLSALLVSHGRRQWTELYSQSWLAAAPLDRLDWKIMVALRACWPPAALLAGTTGVLFLVGVLARVSSSTLFAVALVCAIGTGTGVLIGWWLPQRDLEVPLPPSSLVHRRAGRVPPLSAMSGWPLVQARVRLRPRMIARLMLLALGLPLDVSGNIAVAILWIFIVGLYLSVLLRATVEVAGQGAQWLRPTPLSFARFAWAVIRYPLLKQLLWTALTAGMVTAIGLDPLKALSLAELWLAIFAAVSSIALAHAYESRGMRLKMVVSVCLLAAIETLKHPVALPCALLFSGWQLNRAARS